MFFPADASIMHEKPSLRVDLVLPIRPISLFGTVLRSLET